MSDIKLRKIKHQDKERIYDMTRNIWGGNDYIPKVFEELVEDSRSNLMGIESNGRIIALSNLFLIDKNTGWLEALRVDPEFTGKGWGKMMVKHMCHFAIDKGLSELFFSTYYRNKASINLNEKFGFRKYATFTNLSLNLENKKLENDNKDIELQSLDKEVYKRIVWNDWFAVPEGKKLVKDRFPKVARIIVNGNEFLISENHKERTSLEISPVNDSSIDYETVKSIINYAVKEGYREAHLMLASDIALNPFTENNFEYMERSEDVYIFSVKKTDLKLR